MTDEMKTLLAIIKLLDGSDPVNPEAALAVAQSRMIEIEYKIEQTREEWFRVMTGDAHL